MFVQTDRRSEHQIRVGACKVSFSIGYLTVHDLWLKKRRDAVRLSAIAGLPVSTFQTSRLLLSRECHVTS